MKIERIKLIFLGFILTSGVFTRAGNKPNIVLIMADDLGYECLGVNGSEEYLTPHLDQLAAQGVRFEQCFANPKCTPSRVKIMTGMYNARNYTKFAELDRSQKTFAHFFKSQGYVTAIAGKWQLGSEKDSPQHFGFDESCLWQHLRGRLRTIDGQIYDSRYLNPQLEINGEEVNYYNGEYGPDICSDFICNFIKKNKDKPFLAYYPMILPHWPFCSTPDSEDWNPKLVSSPAEGNTGTEKEQNSHFKDMVEYVDKLVGKVLKVLDCEGIRENTLVVFLGDNGTATSIVSDWNRRQIRGGKNSLTEEGTRVPCIFNWPQKIQPSVEKTELVELSDILPTLCDLIGVKLPTSFPADGISLNPVLFKTGQRNKNLVCLQYKNAMSRNLNYGVTRQKRKDGGVTFLYHKYGGHYESLDVKATEISMEEKYQFDKLKVVLENLHRGAK